MPPKRKSVETEPETPSGEGPGVSAPTKPKPKRKKPSPPKAPRCNCRGDCKSSKCGCGKKGKACSDSCKCTGCRNPFKILEEYNIDCAEAVNDRCLMDNIFKIEDLRARLEERHVMDCCGSSVQLKDMIPGETGCVGMDGDDECFTKNYADWTYSWCFNSFCESEHRPRNHCEKCRHCGDYRDAHCEKCNKCYFAGLSGFECPCSERPPRGKKNAMSMMLWAMQHFAGDALDGDSDESDDGFW